MAQSQTPEEESAAIEHMNIFEIAETLVKQVEYQIKEKENRFEKVLLKVATNAFSRRIAELKHEALLERGRQR